MTQEKMEEEQGTSFKDLKYYWARTKGSVQFITHQTEKYSYLDSARIALEGGCKWIQLRMKEASLEEIEAVAHPLKQLCKKHKAIFIMDDQVELAKKLEADGVHLGKHDMPIAEARRILGDVAIIGGTANTFEDVQAIVAAGADYVGCGPFRFTTTKKNLSPVLGLEGYRSICQQMKDAGIYDQTSIVGIGGITNEDIADMMETGIHGIALSGSILRAEDPIEEMKRVMKLTQDYQKI